MINDDREEVEEEPLLEGQALWRLEEEAHDAEDSQKEQHKKHQELRQDIRQESGILKGQVLSDTYGTMRAPGPRV